MRHIIESLTPWVVLILFLVTVIILQLAFGEPCQAGLERCTVYKESTRFLGG